MWEFDVDALALATRFQSYQDHSSAVEGASVTNVEAFSMTSAVSLLSSKAKVAIFLAGVALAVSVLDLITDFNRYGLIGRLINSTATLEEANASDHMILVMALLVIAVFIIAAIAYLVWVNGANKALRSLGVQDMKFSPAYAVGTHFIPIYNLLSGYQVMDEIWKAGHAPQEHNSGQWKLAPASTLVALWWLAWIGAGIIQRVSNAMAGRDPTLTDIQFATLMSMFSTVVAILSCVLHMKVLREATDAIERKAAMARSVPAT